MVVLKGKSYKWGIVISENEILVVLKLKK